MQIRPFQAADEPAVIRLWEQCGLIRPWNDPAKDIRRKQQVRPDLFLVGVVDGRIIGSVMGGYEGHRGWANYLAVSPAHRRIGLARRLMEEIERLLRQAGCPKINLMVRRSNPEVVEFYRHLGFTIEDVVSMGKRLENDEGGEGCKTKNRSADEEFVRLMESGEWPCNQWHHREHIKLAYLYLRASPLPEALKRMRQTLQFYNGVQKVPEALERGYHETLTRVWMQLVDLTLGEFGPATGADEFVDKHVQLTNARAPLFFYSRPRLFSAEAKREFIEPDLAPLPVRRNGANLGI